MGQTGLRGLLSALRQHGTTVESHVYEGEGHGWSTPETVSDELVRIDQFLDAYLRA